jgi:hypothetical protein
VVILGWIGTYMFIESLQQIRRARGGKERLRGKESLFIRVYKSLPWQMRFEKSGVTHSPLMPLFLGSFAGMLGGSWDWEGVLSWCR